MRIKEAMRGHVAEQSSMLCLISIESRVAVDHPLRTIKRLADEALSQLGRTFSRMYAKHGRPSVPPERLLKALLLMALHSVRSERQLCEHLEYNLLFRWFLDMDAVEPSFDASTFSHNRERLLHHEVAPRFLCAVIAQAKAAGLMSAEHFSVDGTLIEAWASIKSFRPRGRDDSDGQGWGDFVGEQRTNDTHESKTDPEARLMRKGNGREAKLSYSGHALMENRHGLLVDLRIAQADGRAERDVALQMFDAALANGTRTTVAADRGYDTRDFVARCRQRRLTPHIAQNVSNGRRSAIDGRTTRHAGYRMSLRARMLIEKIFGWVKTVGRLRRTRFRGKRRTQLAATMVAAAYNLLRMSRLLANSP